MNQKSKKTIVHLIYCFDTGGLERVLVNMINAMPENEFKHVIISLTHASDFAKNLSNNVEVIELHKKPGNDFSTHFKLFKHLREIKPAIMHSYNLAAIEYHPIAWLAGVKGHVHAEHGRDIGDPEGLNKKHNFLRKIMSYCINYIVPVSRDLEQWLINHVGINKRKVKLVYNGMSYERFQNDIARPHDINSIVFGTVARLSPIKDQQNLLHAFALLIEENLSINCKLKIVGDGPSANSLKQLSQELNISKLVEFVGNSNEIANELESLDVFVLSSLAEGIPMTILEAMASGLPIVSTNVGGIPELVIDDVHGKLVDKADSQKLSEAMKAYIHDTSLIAKHGQASQEKIVNEFSERSMVSSYLSIYQKLV